MVDGPSLIGLTRRAAPSAGAPVFARVAIVGLRGPGAAIAAATRRTWPVALVLGIDGTDRVERAIRLGLIEVGSADPGLAGGADLVVLASTPADNAALLPALDGFVDGAAVITDLGDQPRAMIEAARRLPPRLAFVAGRIVGGDAPADSDAFNPDWIAGRRWLLAASPGASPARDRVHRFAAELGAQPEVLSLDELERR